MTVICCVSSYHLQRCRYGKFVKRQKCSEASPVNHIGLRYWGGPRRREDDVKAVQRRSLDADSSAHAWITRVFPYVSRLLGSHMLDLRTPRVKRPSRCHTAAASEILTRRSITLKQWLSQTASLFAVPLPSTFFHGNLQTVHPHTKTKLCLPHVFSAASPLH